MAETPEEEVKNIPNLNEKKRMKNFESTMS